MGVFGHRAKRVQRCQRPTINHCNDFNDLRSILSMMDCSAVDDGLFNDQYWGRLSRPSTPLHVARITFSASNFGFKICFVFKAPKSSQNRPKPSQNPPPDPSKADPKLHLMLQTPKIKNNATLPRFCSFLTFPDLRKSSQNRCKNAFKISFMLETLLEP